MSSKPPRATPRVPDQPETLSPKQNKTKITLYILTTLMFKTSCLACDESVNVTRAEKPTLVLTKRWHMGNTGCQEVEAGLEPGMIRAITPIAYLVFTVYQAPFKALSILTIIIHVLQMRKSRQRD